MLDRTIGHVHRQQGAGEHVVAPVQIPLVGIGQRLAQQSDEALQDGIEFLRENLRQFGRRRQATPRWSGWAPTSRWRPGRWRCLPVMAARSTPAATPSRSTPACASSGRAKESQGAIAGGTLDPRVLDKMAGSSPARTYHVCRACRAAMPRGIGWSTPGYDGREAATRVSAMVRNRSGRRS